MLLVWQPQDRREQGSRGWFTCMAKIRYPTRTEGEREKNTHRKKGLKMAEGGREQPAWRLLGKQRSCWQPVLRRWLFLHVGGRSLGRRGRSWKGANGCTVLNAAGKTVRLKEETAGGVTRDRKTWAMEGIYGKPRWTPEVGGCAGTRKEGRDCGALGLPLGSLAKKEKRGGSPLKNLPIHKNTLRNDPQPPPIPIFDKINP